MVRQFFNPLTGGRSVEVLALCKPLSNPRAAIQSDFEVLKQKTVRPSCLMQQADEFTF